MAVSSLAARQRWRAAWPGAARAALGWAGLALAVVALLSAAVNLSPQRIAISADGPAAARALYGLGPAEAGDQGSFRWSGDEWGVAIFGFTRPGPAILSIEASATRPADQPAATLEVGGASTSATVELAREWRTYHLLTHPNADLSGRQVVPLRSSTFAPASQNDGRQLGVAVRRVEVAQAARPNEQPLTPRALFLAGVALLVAAALRLAGLQAGVLALATIGLAALLGMLHLGDSSALAFFFPNNWRLLGGAALALGAGAWLRRQGSTTAEFAEGAEEHNTAGDLSDSRRPPRAGRFNLLAIGGGIALAGALTLWASAPAWLGLPLLLAGAGLALAGPAGRAEAKPEVGGRSAAYALAGITLAGLALRLVLLNDLPIALWRDEVYHGLLAREIWRNPGFRPIYVPSVDLPALLFYLSAPAIGVFGADLWTLRLVPALAGALTPLALWFAARPIVGGRAALVAAWFMAVAAWSLYMSRWAFPVILDPLLVLLAIGCVWRGLGPAGGRRAALWLAGGGACAGLALYTYHTGRLAPAVVGLFALARLWGLRRRPPWGALAWGALAFGLVAAPLALYALTNPADFSKRIDDVSVFNGPGPAPVAPLSVLEDNITRYALMWHVEGDGNPRHFAPNRPVLDPASGVLFLLGLGVLLTRRDLPAALLLAWLGLGMLPGVLSDVPPHAMRSIGALAPACVLIGIGMARVQGLGVGDQNSSSVFRPSSFVLRPSSFVLRPSSFVLRLPSSVFRLPSFVSRLPSFILLVTIALWQAGVYFGTTSDQQVMYHHFETARTLLARAARAAALTATADGSRYNVYLWDDTSGGRPGQIVGLLVGDAPVGRFDGQALDPAPGERALLLLPGHADDALRDRALAALGPGARLLRSGPPTPGANTPIYLALGVGPEAAWLAEQLPLP